MKRLCHLMSIVLVSTAASAALTDFGLLTKRGTTMTGYERADTARSTFLSRLMSDVMIENFESFSTGILPATTSIYNGAGTLDTVGSTQLKMIKDIVASESPIFGNRSFWAKNDSVFEIHLDSAVNAFGLNVSDYNSSIYDNMVELIYEGETTGSFVIPHNGDYPDYTIAFFGFVADTKFDTIRIVNHVPTDYVLYDNFIVGNTGTTVPVPSAILLGLLGISLIARRR